jgi:glutathione S-transferase
VLLYSFSITPNNRKVHAFIIEYDLDVEVRQISFKDQEHQSPEYLKMNPMGKVPLLVDGDFTLWESNAILTYLASVFPETKALPTDIRGRADVDRWLHWQSCHLMPAMGALKASDEKDLESIRPLLEVLEIQLTDKEYVCDNLGVADFAIVSYTLTKLGRKLDYSGLPNVVAWRDRMADLKGFVDTQYGGGPPK